MGLSYKTAQSYFNAITVIEAQGIMVDLNVSDYPRMKGDARKKYHRNMRKMAYPKGLQKEISFEEFAEKMNGRRTDSN